MLKKVFLWLAVILTCCTIFAFSSTEGNHSEKLSEKITEKGFNIVGTTNHVNDNNDAGFFDAVHKIVRKSAHVIEFAVLGGLVFLLLRSYEIPIRKSIILALFISLIYAVSDELHQRFVKGRNCAIIDVLVDFIGISIGVYVTRIFEKIKAKKYCK